MFGLKQFYKSLGKSEVFQRYGIFVCEFFFVNIIFIICVLFWLTWSYINDIELIYIIIFAHMYIHHILHMEIENRKYLIHNYKYIFKMTLEKY